MNLGEKIRGISAEQLLGLRTELEGYLNDEVLPEEDFEEVELRSALRQLAAVIRVRRVQEYEAARPRRLRAGQRWA